MKYICDYASDVSKAIGKGLVGAMVGFAALTGIDAVVNTDYSAQRIEAQQKKEAPRWLVDKAIKLYDQKGGEKLYKKSQLEFFNTFDGIANELIKYDLGKFKFRNQVEKESLADVFSVYAASIKNKKVELENKYNASEKFHLITYELNPKDVDNLINMSALYASKLNRLDLAKKYIAKALDIDPNNRIAQIVSKKVNK